MQKHASGADYDPSAWAKQRQERIKRALQVGVMLSTLMFLRPNRQTRPHQQLTCLVTRSVLPTMVGRSYLPSFTVLPRGILGGRQDSLPSVGTNRSIGTQTKSALLSF